VAGGRGPACRRGRGRAAAGHRISARDGLLRASNYYRSAEFFLHGHPDDPRHYHAYDRSVECFRTAAQLFTTPRKACAALLDYHLRDGIAEKITCPALVCDAASDLFLTGRAQQLFDHLTCRKTFLQCTAEEGADAHCQAGAQRLALARIFNWLDDTLRSP